MADPFSIAAGVVGTVSLSLQLLGGCIKGFIILSTARNLEKDAATIVCMLNLQEIHLINWARHAGLLTDRGLLDPRINARAVEDTLRQLQSLLSDTEQLKKKYGLVIQSVPSNKLAKLELTDTVAVNTGISDDARNAILRRSRITEGPGVLQRFWWATVDKEKIEHLVAEIRTFVRELWHLLDPWRQDDLIASTQSIAASMISLNERFDQLNSLSEALSGTNFPQSGGAFPSGINGLATSAKIKAYRIGLEQAPESSPTGQDQNLSRRQRLLQGLENLSARKLGQFNAINKSQTMGMATYDDEIVFVEAKSLAPAMEQKGLVRAQALAALLNVPKERSFGSLQCRGIIETLDGVKFVFEHPYPGFEAQEPRTLLQLFHPREGIHPPPSLTDRIRLAHRITLLVRNFHRAGWLHKSLRSENILFFPKAQTSTARQLMTEAEPLLAGFAFSRQNLPTEVSEQPSVDPALDIYRHPAALGEPSTSFTPEMDVYSLGTVLLEIAEWRPLRHLVESVVDTNSDPVRLSQIAAIRPFLLSGKGKGGTSRLQERAGDIYNSVCQICFSGKILDGQDDHNIVSDTSTGLLDTIVARLGKCHV